MYNSTFYLYFLLFLHLILDSNDFYSQTVGMDVFYFYQIYILTLFLYFYSSMTNAEGTWEKKHHLNTFSSVVPVNYFYILCLNWLIMFLFVKCGKKKWWISSRCDKNQIKSKVDFTFSSLPPPDVSQQPDRVKFLTLFLYFYLSMTKTTVTCK